MVQAHAESLATSDDAIRRAVDRLEGCLPRREDTAVLIDLLEDDLREGVEAVAEVEAHFADILRVLTGGRLTPIALLNVSEDHDVLKRLDYLTDVVTHLRRRLSQAAGGLRARADEASSFTT